LNFLSKIAVFLPAVVLLSGCDGRTDQTLLPPDNARRVTVAIRVPEGITLLPMQMLYRSERCKSKDYNSSNEAYEIWGFNGFKQAFRPQGSGDLWQQNIAIDGGGPCQWQLNSLRVSFKISDIIIQVMNLMIFRVITTLNSHSVCLMVTMSGVCGLLLMVAARASGN
jgi:hypothetical protein